MKKNNRNLFIGAFAVIGVGAYLVYRFISKKQQNNMNFGTTTGTTTGTTAGSGSNSTNITTQTSLPVASYPLKVGSKGSNVIVLQKWLNDNGYASPKLVPDADFGAKTESAVKQMQEYANDKRIIDYNLWNSDYKNGQITQDFYQIFVIKTKAVPSKGASGIDFNLGLGF